MVAPTTSKRVLELDIAKGMLVLIMLIYHSASVAIYTEPKLLPIMEATSFLHYVFVFLTGYISGWLYMPQLPHNAKNVRKRVRVRAFKIVALMLALNVLVYAIGVFNWADWKASFTGPQDIITILTQGISGSIYSFEILFYIAYFLLFASFFMGFDKNGNIGALRLAITATFILLSPFSNIAFYFAFGTVGLLLGYVAHTGRLTPMWRTIEKHWYIVLISFITLIVFHHAIHDFLLNAFPWGRLIAYSLDCALWLTTLIFLIIRINNTGLNEIVIKLGAYTLLAYITQMFLVRIGYIILPKLGMAKHSYYFSNLLISTASLILLIYVADYIRKNNKSANQLYRLVFA